MEKISQNAIKILERLKIQLNIETDTDLADILGVKQNTISTWKARDSIDFEKIISICDKKSIDLNYVFLGIIQKQPSENVTKNVTEDVTKSVTSLSISTNLSNTDINISSDEAIQVLKDEGLMGRKIWIAPEPAMAGTPSSYISDENENNLPYFFLPFLKKNGLYACFQVQGRSMEEYILDGSWVVCRLLENDWQIRSGNIHLIATRSEGLLLKRIHIDDNLKQKGIICYSDNPRYTPFFLSNKEIMRIWSVEMFLRSEFYFSSERAEEQLWEYLDKIKKDGLNAT